MTPEQKQRIEQIRERQKWRANAQRQNGRTPESNQEYADVDFLLSLVKSQEAADPFVGPCVNCGHNNYDTERKECAQRWMEGRMSVVCGCPCAKHNSLANVADRIRSACVEKVSQLADEWLKRAIKDEDAERSRNLRLSYNVAQTIIGELESVSLDGRERSAQTAAIERCLRQVKMMRVNWEDGMRWPHQGDLLDEVISRMESLTLQEQEAKQS